MELPVGTTLGNVVRVANLARVYDPAALCQMTFRFLKQYPNNEFFIDNVTGHQVGVLGRAQGAVRRPGRDHRLQRQHAALPRSRVRRPLVVEVLELAAVGSALPVPEALDSDGSEFGIQSYGLVADTDAFLLTYGDRGPSDGSPDVRLALIKPLDRELVDRYRMQIVAVDDADFSRGPGSST